LQPNAQFSDGTAITAQDVKFSLQRMAKGTALGSQLTGMKGITVVNSKSVRVDLASPSRVFLNALATVGSAGILNAKAVQANANYFTHPVDTSGPWQLVKYTLHSDLTLSANTHYWRTGYPKIKSINYTFGEDPTAAAAALQSGAEDMYYPIDPQDAIRLAKAGVTKTYVAKQPGVVQFGMVKTKPPFNNVKVRLALAYMAPRADKLKACWAGIGPISWGNIVYKGTWAYSPGVSMFKVPSKVALQRASKLMDQAGWKMGSNGVRVAANVRGVRKGTPLKVTVPYENNWQQAQCHTLLLQHDEAPLGVQIVPQAYDAATFYQKVGKNAFSMFHAGDGWATVDQEFEQGFTCKGQATNLIAKWCNKTVDRLVAQAGATSSLTKAKNLYHQAQIIIEKQEPAIITGAQYSIVSASVKLHGFYARTDDSNRSLISATLSS
jgi:ABC-type transport system substrate-binding protein